MGLINKVIRTIKNEGFRSLMIKVGQRFSGFLLSKLISRPSRTNWSQIKDSYKGETVYLIGNGPSLNETPLYLLKGQNTMVFNRFSLMLERINWQPTFYSVTDDLVLENMIDEATQMSEIAEKAFFPDISFRGNVLFKKFQKILPNVYWLRQRPKLGFSTNLPDIFCGGTVIYEGFQILNFLGFSKIVFVGVDMNYKIHSTASSISLNKTEIQSENDDDPNHFDPRYFGKGRKYHQPEKKVIDNIFVSLSYLSRIMKDIDIQIVNAGTNSSVDYFPRTTLIDELGFSDEDVESKFYDLLGLYNYEGVESFETLARKPLDSDCLPEKFRVKKKTALKLIKNLAGQYIPLGPFQDEYFFIRKR